MADSENIDIDCSCPGKKRRRFDIVIFDQSIVIFSWLIVFVSFYFSDFMNPTFCGKKKKLGGLGRELKNGRKSVVWDEKIVEELCQGI